ncbi:MAG: hypothetical protein AMXMBFR81_23190 [Chthonomonas sp.]
MKKQRGTTMIELLLAAMISLIIGAVTMVAFTDSVTMRDVATGQNRAFAMARTAVDSLADHLRNAQSNAGDADTAIGAATKTSVTYYGLNEGALHPVTYFLEGTQLKRTDAEGTKVVLNHVSSLEFSYFKTDDYTAPTWTPTTNPHVPTSAERPKLAAVGIKATVTADGYQRTLRTFVRLRNSPAQ